MGQTKPLSLPQDPEPLAARIAMGLHKIGLAMKQQAWLQASEEGVSATQGQIVAVLAIHGAMTGTELSERLALTLPTISDSVRVLVEKGLVARSPDPRHPRATLLSLSERGADLGARARSWPEFMAGAVGELGPEEQRVFFVAIVKMIRSLQEQGHVPLAGMCVTCTQFRPHVRPGATPHHCALINAPLGLGELRIDCPEHDLAAPAPRREIWEQFLRAM